MGPAGVRAKTTAMCAAGSPVTDVFSPLRRQPPSTGVAVAVIAAASEPLPGSVRPRQSFSSPRSSAGRSSGASGLKRSTMLPSSVEEKTM